MVEEDVCCPLASQVIGASTKPNLPPAAAGSSSFGMWWQQKFCLGTGLLKSDPNFASKAMTSSFSLGYLNYKAPSPANTIHAYNLRVFYNNKTRITNWKTIKTLNFRNNTDDAKCSNIRRAPSLACASNHLKPALFPTKIHLPLMCLVVPHLIFWFCVNYPRM